MSLCKMLLLLTMESFSFCTDIVVRLLMVDTVQQKQCFSMVT